MAGKRKNYSAEFKAKVALEAIRGEMTVTELVARHGVHQTVINTWKRRALDGIAGLFCGTAETKAAEKEGEIEKLHAKIGQRVVKRVLFSQSLRSMSVARRREMIEPQHPSPPVTRQCALIGICPPCAPQS